uniref:Uncharacterized protein n=1 Tax=virus sp. ctBM815 TaxID=2825806 RepID=A0A8S5RJV6_9VIRU|nr:MAG TPA: hypothetical protein [virus sp. ctBM815]
MINCISRGQFILSPRFIRLEAYITVQVCIKSHILQRGVVTVNN